MAKQYVSLQGRFYLSPIVEGVVGAMRELGNVPEFELEIDADVVEHNESMTGQRTPDFTLVRATSVNFSGQLEQIDDENMAYILSGDASAIASKTVTDQNLGDVVAGQKIKLDGFNLSAVSFTDSASTPATIDPSKYTVDSKFGTVVFNDLTGITTPIRATYTTGAVKSTTLASNFNNEYALYFEGINTATGESWAVNLHRTKKSPNTTFGLIHEELGQYSIEGRALSDITKQSDPTLGLFGNVTIIPNLP